MTHAATSPTLADLNSMSEAAFTDALRGIYEHSPWIPARAAHARPYATPAALKLALQDAVTAATLDEQLGLIRAHPELAGKAAIAGELTAESTHEQAASGLNLCSADEYATLHRLNADYNAKFGFPFILAVKGPDGKGFTRAAIIATFTRRLRHQRAAELAECLRQIHRIAELRINDLLGVQSAFGAQVMAWADTLASWSDAADNLTCAYLTPAHQRSALQLADWMRDAGMDVHIDDVGNVVGRYAAAGAATGATGATGAAGAAGAADATGATGAADAAGAATAATGAGAGAAKTLITGSHYDTVRDGGKYDGRLGILLPIAVVGHLHARGERLPYHLEVIGFAEEEGVRFKSTFLGSNAVIGQFDLALLDAVDADGVRMGDALAAAGHDADAIAAIARDPATLLGFVEIHIEQGPVLLERGLALGVVTAIAGSSRYLVELTGLASHAGTTPMTMRRDAAAAAAEIVLLVEQRCSTAPALVGTVGQLNVPNGSVNVIPGHCQLSLDIRAADDAVRLAAVDDILAGIEAICARRQVDTSVRQVVSAQAAPCAPALMEQLGAAVERAGLPRFDLPSGAGHDAMAMAKVCDVAMLFTRCGNGGISHNRLETMTGDDADLAGQVLLDFLRHLPSYGVSTTLRQLSCFWSNMR